MHHTNQLRRHRRHWALSQRQLAHLLGLRARSVISNHELGTRLPALRLALGYQFIFGASLDTLFPKLRHEVETEIVGRATRLDEECREGASAQAARIREFLQELVSRAHSVDGA